MKYRKKPVVIEAMQLPAEDEECTPELAEFLNESKHEITSEDAGTLAIWRIDTLEGVMVAEPGDWIIKGIQGEYYPCKPDIFEATYEIASKAKSLTGISAISLERQRQFDEEGWTPEHDDEHTSGEMATAAACYLAHGQAINQGGVIHPEIMNLWPWESSWWKPSDDPIRNLEKAGALIAAEIDRLTRAKK